MRPRPPACGQAVISPARGSNRHRLRDRLAGRMRDERGDVPGWVLVTIMSAGIVAVLWPFAESYLQQILQAALDLVAP
ncbi:hypothetical protein [Phytoactinopolyspora halotolerans]|uniref:Uncharacterized protein n=1 Tax=Phytoactinopolyspora halotolerans TaxID=1981512 RepID=A0A6L9SD54_9ACTN|nr:hypothetical protein [Phytoactinopolyspora halotolerans]NEE03305.1 hypothetical protein [Phytoactinopolyspora halotolerans]